MAMLNNQRVVVRSQYYHISIYIYIHYLMDAHMNSDEFRFSDDLVGNCGTMIYMDWNLETWCVDPKS